MTAVAPSARRTGCSRRPASRRSSFFLGHISYSVYLFHIVIVMALKPLIGGWPLGAQFALYLASVFAFSTLFWRGFERPILAARPDYKPRRERSASRSRAHGARAAPRRRIVTAGLGLACSPRSSSLATPSWRTRRISSISRSSRRRCLRSRSPSARGGSPRASASLRARSSSSRSPCLRPMRSIDPRPASRSRARSQTRPIPIAERAKIRPPSRCGGSTISTNGSAKTASAGRSRSPILRASFPSCSRRVVRGACSTRRSASIRPASAGRRSQQDKGDRFRIVALGESQTFGPTLREGEKPWPECLQDAFDAKGAVRPSDRGHQRRNRGLYARGQSREDAAGRAAAEARSHPFDPRHERPLRARPAPAARTQRTGPASARLSADRPRAAHDRARRARLAKPRRVSAAAGRRRRCRTRT